MSDPAEAARRRAGDRCEYCRLPQTAFRRRFHIEHIVARQHGGSTNLDNLAFACWNCNLKKGPNLSGTDPETGQVTGLFHPRKDDGTNIFLFMLAP
jgi:5-methylcytosine-specific restriction endonuclease McrA